MVYTLAQGAKQYNNRLHYSLYGGVEYYPNKSFAIKELLPLIAIPAVAIAILAFVISFHVPNISPTTGGAGHSAANSHNKTFSLVITPGSKPTGSTSNSGDKSSTGSGSSSTSAPSNQFSAGSLTTLTPAGNDNGQGIIGGMGGGDTTSVAPTPPSSTTLSTSDPTGTLQTSATVSGTTATVNATVTSPVNDKTLLNTNTTIDP